MINNTRVLDNLIAAIESRNAPAVGQLFAEDVVFENVAEGTSTHGRLAAQEKFTHFFAKASSIQWDIQHKLIDGDFSIVELKNHICFQGKNIILPMVNIIRYKHGKVILFRDYFDAQTFMRQLED